MEIDPQTIHSFERECKGLSKVPNKIYQLGLTFEKIGKCDQGSEQGRGLALFWLIFAHFRIYIKVES